MKNVRKGEKKVGFVIATAVASLLLPLMIKTVILKISFGLSFFTLALLLSLYLFSTPNGEREARYKLVSRAHVDVIMYCFAIASSFSMLYIPVTNYHLGDAWMLFTSFNVLETIRIVSGCFVLTTFPGYVVYRAFVSNKLDNTFGKLSLVLALSYIINVALGLLLSYTAGLTLVHYLFTLWIFVLACEALRRAFKREREIPTTHFALNNFIKNGLIVSTCIILVLSSYVITLSADPKDFALGGDIAYYVSNCNSFLRGQPFSAHYVWFQVFIGVASMLTGLYPIHAFISIQFLMVLFPLSFYTLIVKVFKNSKLATVGTVITTVTGGLSSIGILGLFQEYNQQESIVSTLSTLRTKTQNWPWLSNHFFIVSTIDWSLLMLGLSYAYCYIKGHSASRLNNLILGSLFFASTFFTHSIIGIIISLPAILFFSLLDYKHLKRAALFCLITFLAVIAFDKLSYDLFVNTLSNYYLQYGVFFAGSLLFPYQWGTIVLLAVVLLALLIRGFAGTIKRRSEHLEISRILSTKILSYVCVTIALVSFVVPLTLVFIRFNDTILPQETIFPWYVYALRSAPLLQLAILSIPIILKRKHEERLGAYLMMSWVVSAFLVVGLNVLFPRFITPPVVNRVLMSIYLPLGTLSALTLVSLKDVKTSKANVLIFRFSRCDTKVHISHVRRYASVYLLTVVLAFSFLSHVYSIEIFYQANMLGSMPNEEKDLYEYLKNLPPNAKFLTYSFASYLSISSLAIHETHAYHQYGNFVSWPAEILFRLSSPEAVSYLLSRFEITHVVLTKSDSMELLEFSNSSLVFMLNFFPICFSNSVASVYSVPAYLLDESSNYAIIKPTTKLAPDMVHTSSSNLYNVAYDSLTINEVPFTIVQDYEVSTLAPNHVYILSSSWANNLSSNDLIDHVKSGTRVIALYEPETFDGNELLNSLKIQIGGTVPISSASVNEEIFHLNFTHAIVANLTTRGSPYSAQAMTFYTTMKNESVPMIIRFSIGNGSITLINWPTFSTLSETLHARVLADMAINAIRKAIAALPKPEFSGRLKTLPFPEDLFALGNPTLINIYKEKGLANYIYAFQDIKLRGNISMTSDYVFWNASNLHPEKIILQNLASQELLENVTVTSVYINGLCNTSLITQDALIYSFGGELGIVKMSSLRRLRVNVENVPINLTFEKNGAKKSLSVSRGCVEFIFTENFTTDLRLEKPFISLREGSMDTLWKGIFWDDGKMFTTVSRSENWIISGALSLRTDYCDGVIGIRLLHVETVSVTVHA